MYVLIASEYLLSAKHSESNFYFSTILTLLLLMESGPTTIQVCGSMFDYFINQIYRFIFMFQTSMKNVIYRQQKLKEDMSVGKTRDALMKVGCQKHRSEKSIPDVFQSYNISSDRLVTVERPITELPMQGMTITL